MSGKKKDKHQTHLEATYTPIPASESEYLYVQTSQLKQAGKGLFTAISLEQYEIIAYYNGEILTAQEVKRRKSAGKDAYFMMLQDGRTLDCMNKKGFAKYANDATGKGSSKFSNNAIITLDSDDKVCLVAITKIHAGKEIFCSYGSTYWQKQP